MCVLRIFIRNSLHFKGKPELLKIFETYHFCFNFILQNLIAECLAKKLYFFSEKKYILNFVLLSQSISQF